MDLSRDLSSYWAALVVWGFGFGAGGAWLFVTAHTAQPVEVSGIVRSFDVDLGCRRWTKEKHSIIVLRDSSALYKTCPYFRDFTRELPDSLDPGQRVTLWVDRGTDDVLALDLVGQTRYETPYLEHPDRLGTDHRVQGLLAGAAGGIAFVTGIGLAFASRRGRKGKARPGTRGIGS